MITVPKEDGSYFVLWIVDTGLVVDEKQLRSLVRVASAVRRNDGTFDVILPSVPDLGPDRRVALVRNSNEGWHAEWCREVTDPPSLGDVYQDERSAIEGVVGAIFDRD